MKRFLAIVLAGSILFSNSSLADSHQTSSLLEEDLMSCLTLTFISRLLDLFKDESKIIEILEKGGEGDEETFNAIMEDLTKIAETKNDSAMATSVNKMAEAYQREDLAELKESSKNLAITLKNILEQDCKS